MPPSVRKQQESSGTDMPDWDWFPDHYPSSFLFVLLFYFTERGYHTGISTTHDTRHSNHKTQQPNGILQGHRDRRRSEHHRPSSIVRNKGWYPIEMERNNNNMNIGNNNNKRRRPETRTGAADAGNFIYLGFNE